jgi:hypothetical protein
VARLVTSSVPLAETISALEKLSRQEGVKTVVRCDGGVDAGGKS